MIWFTADTHFGHENVIEFCDRPYSSIEEHDIGLIANINAVVKPNDILWHLGDFSYRNTVHLSEYRNRINVKFVGLIMGNHDPHGNTGHAKPILRQLFQDVQDMHNLKVDYDGQRVSLILSHYAMRVWKGSHKGTIHLYGHSHGTLPDDPHARSMDVGVDCTDYRPVSLPEIVELMSKKVFVPVDHHAPMME